MLFSYSFSHCQQILCKPTTHSVSQYFSDFLTPFMKTYKSLKMGHKDMVLFFKEAKYFFFNSWALSLLANVTQTGINSAFVGLTLWIWCIGKFYVMRLHFITVQRKEGRGVKLPKNSRKIWSSWFLRSVRTHKYSLNTTNQAP